MYGLKPVKIYVRTGVKITRQWNSTFTHVELFEQKWQTFDGGAVKRRGEATENRKEDISLETANRGFYFAEKTRKKE